MLTQAKDALRHTRQHHAIEHATLHILAARYPSRRMVGYSDPRGFTIFGDLTEEAVRRAVSEAILRLQSGESQLAIHPNCGTNLAATGVLVTLAALIGGSMGRRDPFTRFSYALTLVLPVLVMAPALGQRLQRATTLANTSDRWVKDVRRVELAGIGAHRVEFQ